MTAEGFAFGGLTPEAATATRSDVESILMRNGVSPGDVADLNKVAEIVLSHTRAHEWQTALQTNVFIATREFFRQQSPEVFGKIYKGCQTRDGWMYTTPESAGQRK